MKLRVLAASAITIVYALAASAGQLVVVEAKGKGTPHTKGEIIPDRAILSLRGDMELTVISEAGEVIRIIGPYEGIPEQKEHRSGIGDFLTALARALKRDERTEIGAMRGLMPDRPDPWFVDVTTTGQKCVSSTAGVRLWRPSSQTALSIEIGPLESDKRSRVDWPGGADTVAWPADLPVKNDEEYEVLASRALAISHSITIHIAPEEFAKPSFAAYWMNQQGCTVQVQRLLESLPVDRTTRD